MNATEAKRGDVLDVKQAAYAISRHPQTVREAIREGELRASIAGRGPRAGYRIREEDLRTWVRERWEGKNEERQRR
jgi:excisionase family DNA binding protein